MKKMIVCLTGVVVIVIACSKGSSTGGGTSTTIDCSGAAKSFTADVNPIIQSSCASSSGCHASGSNNGPGALTTYQQVFNARISIRSAVLSGSMPQNSSLSASQKNAIICWIDNGGVSN